MLTAPTFAQTGSQYTGKITEAERAADRAKAKALYDEQYNRDFREAERLNKTNLTGLAEREMLKARQAAEHQAAMEKWRADVAQQQADYEASVAACIADKSCSPQ